jgi:hypothetical protein
MVCFWAGYGKRSSCRALSSRGHPVNLKFYLAVLRFAWQRLVSFVKRIFSKPTIKKTLADLPVAFREALALHNIFMALGIPESDIYVAYTDKCFQVVAYQNPPQVLLSQELDAEMQKVIDEQGYQAVVLLTAKHFAWAARLKN